MPLRPGTIVALFACLVSPVVGQEASPRITVGKDTTVLTEPLDDEGYVDYVKAIDTQQRKGITPENNANVPLRLLLGSREISEARQVLYYSMLGIDVPEQLEPTVVSMWAIQQELGHKEELEDAIKRPWTEKSSPNAAIWMNRNRDQVRKIREAVARPKFYSPVISDEGRVFSILLPDVQNARMHARVLLADAMLNLGNGKEGPALDDLLATHRLAGHIGNGWTTVEMLVSIAIRNIAYEAEESFLNSVRPGRGKQLFWQRKLQTVRKPRKISGIVRTTERYMALDAVCGVARGQHINEMLRLVGENQLAPAKAAAVTLRVKSPKLDFDAILREVNRTYDLIGDAFAATEPDKRLKVNSLIKEQKDAWKKIVDNTNVAELSFDDKKLQEFVMSLLLSNLTPFLEGARTSEDACSSLGDCIKVGWGVSAWYAKHKAYPENLKQLVPDYLDEVPPDRFTGRPLVFKVKDGRCRIYSVGPNQKDDNFTKRSTDSENYDVGVELKR